MNLLYLSGKNFEQNVELNQKILPYTKTKLKLEAKNIINSGCKGLNISVDNNASQVIDGLIKKIERFYSLCLKEKQYVEKLYATFKILCIGCLNFPEIIPLVLEKKVDVGR